MTIPQHTRPSPARRLVALAALSLAAATGCAEGSSEGVDGDGVASSAPDERALAPGESVSGHGGAEGEVEQIGAAEIGSAGVASERGVASVRGRGWAVELPYELIDGAAVTHGDIELGASETLVAGAVVESRPWPRGEVVYEVDPALPNQGRVTDAIAHWEARTGIRFKQRTTEAGYVRFTTGTGCLATIGFTGRPQVVRLADACSTGSTIHEIGHTVGLWHEQSRSDRDAFVTVHTENIESDKVYNFDKLSFASVGTYDFGSVMHYGSFAFSANKRATITKKDGSVIDANRTALSAGDIAGVAAIYAAESLPPPAQPSVSTARTTVNLNLRRGPGTGYAILATMPASSEVVRLGDTQNGFDRVRYRRLEGWASARFLR